MFLNNKARWILIVLAVLFLFGAQIPARAQQAAQRSTAIQDGLIFSTYLGGGGAENNLRLAVDAQGFTYIAGSTFTDDFPVTAGAYQTQHAGDDDIFIAKLSPDGSELIYATYLGGEGEDIWPAIAVDDQGAVYVTGVTKSPDFPVTSGAFQGDCNQVCNDAFVAKLSPDGSELEYATFLGGTLHDGGIRIAVNADGQATIGGQTASSDFPTTSGAFQPQKAANNDGFITRISADGGSLVYSTFLGGGEADYIHGLALANDGSAIVSGLTGSGNFPITPGAFQSVCNAGLNCGLFKDSFVAKLNPQGDALIFSTFLGGRDQENSSNRSGLAVDEQGAVYAVGHTLSSDFPTTAGAFQPAVSENNFSNAYVAKFTAQGNIVYATYLGGSDGDASAAVAAFDSGEAAVFASTNSLDFPITPDALQSTPDHLAVAILSSDGSALSYGTYFGGSDTENPAEIWAAADGAITLLGDTRSADFPITAGAFSSTLQGFSDAFVTRFNPGVTIPACSPEPGQPVTLCLTDEAGQSLSALSLNEQGWPSPNPIQATVFLSNTSDQNISEAFSLAIDFSDSTAPGRFYVLEVPFDDLQDTSFPYPRDNLACKMNTEAASYSQYRFECELGGLIIEPGQTQELTWQLWIQPSQAAPMQMTATYGTESALAGLSIPQAKIRPVVFVHGILGAMPPGQNFWTRRPTHQEVRRLEEPVFDPFVLSYYPMLDHLERTGYEWGSSLFGLTYDWRQSNDVSAAYLDTQLDGVRALEVDGDYIDHKRSDLVAHSMGGLVSRAYIQNEAIYDDDVGKVVFMASPHKGFAATYRTYEGLSWYDYLENEVAPVSDLDMMNILMDQILWPHLIEEHYAPTEAEINDDCIVIPTSPFTPDFTYCRPAHYDWTHDPLRGVRSLAEMLPSDDLEGGDYLFDAAGGGPWPCNGGSKPAALQNTWLEDLNADVDSLAQNLGGEEQIYVLYSDSYPGLTIGSYEVEDCNGDSLGRWPHGEPQTDVHGVLGDDLIPAASTTLHASGLLNLPAGHEVAVNDLKADGSAYGHKGIVYSLMAESKVSEFLTGEPIPGTVNYVPPFSLANLRRVVAIRVHSPVSLNLTDPHGRQVGYDPAGNEVINQLADAYYTGYRDDQFMLLFNPAPGDYDLAIQGHDSGAYRVETYLIDDAGVRLLDSIAGDIQSGENVQRQLEITADPSQRLFFDDMESGPDLWTAGGGWALQSGDANSPSHAWDSGRISEAGEMILTLNTTLDLSSAERANLSFWGRHDLSDSGVAAVEISTDSGQSWQLLSQRQGEIQDWNLHTLSLDAFSGPGFDALHLRFRLQSSAQGDQWLIDDVLVESLDPPARFYTPFEDDVEGWQKWTPAGDWAVVDDAGHSPEHSWHAAQPGSALILAGELVLLPGLDQTLAFWYQLDGQGSRGLIEVSIEGGEWQTIGEVEPTNGDWQQAIFSLNAYRGQLVTLRMRLNEDAQGAWTLDDFEVSDQIEAPAEEALVEGSVVLEDGRCCVGGVAGQTIQIQAAFEASSNVAAVTEMRVRTAARAFSEGEMAQAEWGPFASQAGYPYIVPINWSTFVVTVQFRDAAGNLSAVVHDDIAVEGAPPQEQDGVLLYGLVGLGSVDGLPLAGARIYLYQSSGLVPGPIPLPGPDTLSPDGPDAGGPIVPQPPLLVATTGEDGAYEAFVPIEGIASLRVYALHPDYLLRPLAIAWEHPIGYERRELNFFAVDNPLSDVPPDHWAYREIMALYDAGYVAGCSTTQPLYCPEQSMSRAEASVFVVRGDENAAYTPAQPGSVAFSDVALSEWYAKWVADLQGRGFTAGCGQDPVGEPLFCPRVSHTRAEATVFFLRMLEGPGFQPAAFNGQAVYQDVPGGADAPWYSKWIYAAYERGLVASCEDDLNRGDALFRPDDELTRAEAACMMVRALELEP